MGRTAEPVASMNEAREEILANIRRALRRARIELFVSMAEEAQATIARVAGVEQVPGAVADYLARENLPAECVMAADPNLDAIPWATRPLLRIRRDGIPAADAATLTPAFAAIAETGTLLLISGPDT